MKKLIYTIGILFLFNNILIAQKLQLTEAATEYKNNFSPMWMIMPDDLDKNKSVLIKAKKAIDECYNKQLEVPFVKPKDEAKMYYYRGMIYLDYTMMAAMDVEIMSELKSMDEKVLEESSIGSLKKCMEIDTRGDWGEEIEAKVNMLRNLFINSGVEMFNQGNFEAAFQSFSMSVDIYDILSIPDTLGMINAALSAERIKNYDDALKYYQMCADNNYGNGAEMYQSMIRVLNAKHGGVNEESLAVIKKGKEKYPGDYILNVEEFNYWYGKGDNDRAQAALQKAVEADPTNSQLHFNIGVVFDNMSVSSHESDRHEEAYDFMERSIESYKSAIEINPDYVDAYFNLGALYYDQSIETNSIANDMDNADESENMAKKADQMMKDALPFLVKSHELNAKDVSTLKVLKSIYFNLEMMDEYNDAKAKLTELGQ